MRKEKKRTDNTTITLNPKVKAYLNMQVNELSNELNLKISLSSLIEAMIKKELRPPNFLVSERLKDAVLRDVKRKDSRIKPM